MSRQPRLSANDWRPLAPPRLGDWEPRLSVTVVIPAYQAPALPWVLAGLAAQSYPEHLLEVIVVDDSGEGIALPEVRPERTRVVATTHGWGRAAACQSGADVAEGDIVHWLDADMVPARHEVEAQLRWHHLVDYAVVLGDKSFADADALAAIEPADLRAAIAAGTPVDDLADGPVDPHAWVERILAETDSLSTAGPRAMRVHTGASASVGRDLLRESGGLPVGLVLGEDIVLGYRLREAGAVFVPDRDAHSLHLGATTVMRGAEQVNRYNKPFLAQQVPEFRGHRLQMPRSYEVPYVEVIVPVAGVSYEDVCVAVDAQLTGGVPDVVVTLVADWSALSDDRRPILADPGLDLRLVRAAYAAEPRVRLADAPSRRSDATFRVTLPGVAVFPVGRSLAQLLRRMELEHLGCVDVDLSDGGAVRVLRTAAHSRALRTSTEPGDYEAALAACYPAIHIPATDAGFVDAAGAPPVKQVRGLVSWGVRKDDPA
ncbi:glycosyltransferase [Nocardioides sp. LMS-CY]|uniref:glycosyltransferase family 2 protein n=1 Tax=Nocardioides sp. (strain LMS-CY) TaxID=2840457 RepID=UPI001C008275|nr:glycosyltransferase family 2 protein [Nocardioides sp. LMS-CY]QWF21666.1 glycosyltransferase [Nocardioides sp. LMS-CY]